MPLEFKRVVTVKKPVPAEVSLLLRVYKILPQSPLVVIASETVSDTPVKD